jgi:hypothetical protein
MVSFTLASVCVAIWIGSFGRAIVDEQYTPPPGLSEVSLAAATYLFGSGLLKQKHESEMEEDEDE